MFWMRAYPLLGQVGEGWALEFESFWALWNGIDPPTCTHVVCHIIQPHISLLAGQLGHQGQPEEVGGQRNAGQEGQQGVGVHHRRTAISIPTTGSTQQPCITTAHVGDVLSDYFCTFLCCWDKLLYIVFYVLYVLLKFWPSPPLTSYIIRLASTLFSCIFTGEGTIGNMVCDSTEHRGQRLEHRPWLASSQA